MQIDNTEFLQLQKEVSRELTCENCNCKFYVIGRRCNASYRELTCNNSSVDIEHTIFKNPYLCMHFWWASEYAFNFREKQLWELLLKGDI
jgi:hypothetical protein